MRDLETTSEDNLWPREHALPLAPTLIGPENLPASLVSPLQWKEGSLL